MQLNDLIEKLQKIAARGYPNVEVVIVDDYFDVIGRNLKVSHDIAKGVVRLRIAHNCRLSASERAYIRDNE